MNKTMNTVNQTFNWSRFVAALRKEVTEKERTILFATLGIYIFLSMIMILGNLVTPSSYMEMQLQNYFPQKVVLTIMSFVCIVISSMAFWNLKTKTKRISFFTSPSSTLEKFLVKILIYVVGTFVVFFICTQLADLTRFAILKLFENENLAVPSPINFATMFSNNASSSFFSGKSLSHLMGLAMFLSLLGNVAIFFMGSVLWPRLSLLKTLAASYAIELMLFIITLFIVIVNFSFDMKRVGEWFVESLMDDKLTIFSIITSGILIMFGFGAAWYLFKRKDVVSLKWWK